MASVIIVSDIAPPGAQGDLVYVRVATDIAARIALGELAPGTRLRSERHLAVHDGVTYGTMRRAMQHLREQGLIVTIHGLGTFVAQQRPAAW